jgi:hypothetical protein
VGGAAVIEERARGLGYFFEDATFAVTGCAFADRAAAADAGKVEGGWPNPFAKKNDKAVPSATTSAASAVGGTETFTATWAFSGTWPLPWRPRARVSGTCEVVTELVGTGSPSSPERRVTGLFDAWVAPAGGTVGLLLTQVVPRTLDVLNVYNSPHAEAVPFKVLDRRNGYDLVQTTPHAVLEVRASGEKSCLRDFAKKNR